MPAALDLALELVRLDTINPPGNEAPAAELLAGRLEAAGLDVARQRPRARSAPRGWSRASWPRAEAARAGA